MVNLPAMIILKTERQNVIMAKDYFFPYIRLLKETKLNNVSGSIMSEEHLSVIAINCLLSDIELLIEKKIINTKGATTRLRFSDAQAVVFYKTLIALPLPADQFYLNNIRNSWIEMLDQELINTGVYSQKDLS